MQKPARGFSLLGVAIFIAVSIAGGVVAVTSGLFSQPEPQEGNATSSGVGTSSTATTSGRGSEAGSGTVDNPQPGDTASSSYEVAPAPSGSSTVYLLFSES